jgi:hypothetical protein
MPANTTPADLLSGRARYSACLLARSGLSPYGTRKQYNPVQLTCVPRSQTESSSSVESADIRNLGEME